MQLASLIDAMVVEHDLFERTAKLIYDPEDKLTREQSYRIAHNALLAHIGAFLVEEGLPVESQLGKLVFQEDGRAPQAGARYYYCETLMLRYDGQDIGLGGVVGQEQFIEQAQKILGDDHWVFSHVKQWNSPNTSLVDLQDEDLRELVRPHVAHLMAQVRAQSLMDATPNVEARGSLRL